MYSYRYWLTAMLSPVLLILVIGYFIQGSATEILVERYVPLNMFLCITAIGAEFIVVLFIFISKKIQFSWYNKFFYYTMLSSILTMILVGFASKGASINSILWLDRKDVLMDFFNSIQYGMYPYCNYVIYPPLINVIYSFIGRFVVYDPLMAAVQYRDTQMGMLCFIIYIICSYSFLIFAVSKFISEKREKILLSVCILFSGPSLFLFDRGNSIILVIPCLLLYVYYYNYVNFKLRLLSYICLSIAVGIKISPIIFSLLIIRKRRFKEFVIFFAICTGFFLIPFLFTDGNIFILIDNIKKTSSMFNGLTMYDSALVAIGHGFNVNIISCVSIFTRIYDVNILPLGYMFSLLFILLTGLFSVFKVDVPMWKIIAILSLVLVICPEFSFIYNIMYMSIPLIMYLSSKPAYSKSNVLYLLLFILMFIPGVNIRLNIFNVFINDAYPVQLMQIVECVGLIGMAIVLVFDVGVVACKKYKENYYNKNWQCVLLAMIVLACCGYKSFALNPMDSFYPKNVYSPTAVKGMYLTNGAYSGIDDKIEICLNTKKLKEYGLVINFYNEKRDMSKYTGEKLSIYINDKHFEDISIDNILGNFAYIQPQVFNEFSDNYVWITVNRIVRKTDECMPIAYAGPAYPGDDIWMPRNLINVSSGIYEGWMGKSNKFIFTYEMLQKGICIDYFIPKELLKSSNNGTLNVNVSIDGKIIKKYELYDSDRNYSIIIDKNTVPNDLLESVSHLRGFILDVSFEGVEDWYSLRDASENKYKAAKIIYVGEVPEYSDVMYGYISNHKTDNMMEMDEVNIGKKIYVKKEKIGENDIELSFNIKPLIFDSSDKFIHIFIDGVICKTLKLDKFMNEYIRVTVLDNNLFKNDISEIEYVVSNNKEQDTKIIDNNSRYLSKYVELKYFGNRINIYDIFSNNEQNENVSKIKIGRKEKNITSDLKKIEATSNGLKYDTSMATWFMSYGAGIGLTIDDIKDHGIIFNCVAENYWFMNNNSPKYINVYVNGSKCKFIKIDEAGAFDIYLSKEEIERFIRDDYIYVYFSVDDVYNQRKLYITRIRDKNYDRSFGITNICKGIL